MIYMQCFAIVTPIIATKKAHKIHNIPKKALNPLYI